MNRHTKTHSLKIDDIFCELIAKSHLVISGKTVKTRSTRYGRRKLKEALAFSEQSAEEPPSLVTNVNKTSLKTRLMGKRAVNEQEAVSKTKNNKKRKANKVAEVNAEEIIPVKRGKRSTAPENDLEHDEDMVAGTSNRKGTPKTVRWAIIPAEEIKLKRRKTNVVTEVDFVEDGDRVLMAVDGQDEEDFGIDTESEREFEWARFEQASRDKEELFNSMDGGESSKNEDLGQTESDEAQTSPRPEIESLSQDKRRKRMREIDMEMKKKLTELQLLMNEGGLEESSLVARKILQGMDTTVLTNFNQNVIRTKSNENGNETSQDKIRKVVHSIDSPSEETIYRKAVKRAGEISNRYSSSSDEDHNISNEMNEMEKLFCLFPGKNMVEERGDTEPGPSNGIGNLGDSPEIKSQLGLQDNLNRQKLTPEEKAEKLI